MANNRMYLKSKLTGEKVLLAKYFPSQGWSSFENLNERMDKVFEGVLQKEYQENAVINMYDGDSFELVFETNTK